MTAGPVTRTIGGIEATAAGRPTISPVLVGRDDLLDLVGRRLNAARSGRGELLLLAGEAGIGKTRLLGVVRRQAVEMGLLVATGAASPYDRDIVGGVLLDLGRSLVAHERSRATGEALLELLAPAAIGTASSPHHGRLLGLALGDALCDLTGSGPTLLAFEDLHWVDDVSLEVIERLARRAASLPLFICASYRTDEIGNHARLREWRALLLGQRHAEEARLRRLTEDETRTVLTSILGLDAPLGALAAAVHGRSDGIPLHVEEMLAALRSRATPLDVLQLPVPETVSAAVLERAQRLAPVSLDIARMSTVIGRAFDLDLLEAIAELPGPELDIALTELYQRQFMTRDPHGGELHFRHGLICDAIYEAIPLRERQRLHARVGAVTASRDGADPSYVARQFDRAGDRANAFSWSLRAARAAAAVSSHRAADAAYRIVLRNMGAAPLRERALILTEHAGEAAASDDNVAAARAYADARAILVTLGERVAAAELAAPLAAALHLTGAGLAERRVLLEAALAEIEAVGVQGALAAQARLRAALATALMLDRRLDPSLAVGSDALRDARMAGDIPTEVNALVTVGAVKVFAGDPAGWTMLEEGLAIARAQGLEAEAARAYRMIGSGSSVLVEYKRAGHFLGEGIAYAERVELWNHRHYMAAHLAHVRWATGRWAEATALVDEVLADGRGGITTRITALHVRGYLALGRDDAPLAKVALEEARRLAERMSELQRLSPALWGLAELALLQGDPRVAADLSSAARLASEPVRDAAYLFPFLVTGTRARLALDDPAGASEWARAVGDLVRERGIPGTLPSLDHANGLVLAAQGSTARARELLTAARRAWLTLDRQWEGTWASIDLARCDLRAGRVDQVLRGAGDAAVAAASLGATALVRLAEELTRIANERGGLMEPWAPLTAREFDVAKRISTGLTNAQIAIELHIAPRTVATHVEHILMKLGASRRSEIASWTTGRMRQ